MCQFRVLIGGWPFAANTTSSVPITINKEQKKRCSQGMDLVGKCLDSALKYSVLHNNNEKGFPPR
jgi:hypothetical protein